MARYITIERSDTDGNYTTDLRELPGSVAAELDDIDYLEPGTTITLTVVEMTDEDYDAMPEFTGW